MLVSKGGVGAVLVPGAKKEDGGALAVKPGIVVREKWRGFLTGATRIH